MAKRHSEACERNQGPILDVLRRWFADRRRVLEIGSGTGQHAVHFGAHLPHLTWQTGDLARHHPGILAWLAEARLANVLPPLALDANAPAWPAIECDAVFTANTLHIMSWPAVEGLFGHLDRLLPAGGVLAVYGPFNSGGRYTAHSNARFDAHLQLQDPAMGIRDFEAVDALARGLGLELAEDCAMPANNRTLVWRRTRAGVV